MRAPADGRACCLRLVLSCLVLSCLVCAVCLRRTCRRGLPAARFAGARHVCPACFVAGGLYR